MITATLDVVDWRRRTFALYAEVRAAADPAEGHARWVRGRNALFATHPASPLLAEDREGFNGLPVAAYDPAWRFEVELSPADPQDWSVETGTDGTVVFERIGTARLELGHLDVWRLTSYGGGIFMPLKDAGSGRPGGSYGGGRYLLDTIKGADLGSLGGRLVLDLNFAYAPSCAHDPRWACPLAPAGNLLEVEVPVGELAGGHQWLPPEGRRA
ncbi:MAG: uncharacterized protein QOD98_2670 [Nocardioidaceae bacterium]|nr:uncharacterized protein [Nocardioidaceae bacterium]